jgi:hypothetical protein
MSWKGTAQTLSDPIAARIVKLCAYRSDSSKSVAIRRGAGQRTKESIASRIRRILLLEGEQMPSWTTMGSSVRLGGRFAAVVPLVCAAALTGPDPLPGATGPKTPKSNTKTFILPAQTTKTFQVGYPLALKFKGARYSCRATVSGLGKGYVKILSRGSALGGTVCRVKARNNAMLPSLDTTANLKVIATTIL